jgi:formylmethanofuran dehydrogenase subunit A
VLTCLKGGRILDPANDRDAVDDLWIDGDAITAPPLERKADETVDAAGLVVMAGGIDIHSHIAGANVNTARLLLPEEHRTHTPRPASTPLSNAGWSTFQTGRLYAELGFTTVVEPAISPHQALHAHLELADIPIIDKAILAVLGNDDFMLRLIAGSESDAAIEDYVAWTLGTTRALGIKVINAGGVAAFKENVRSFSFDDVVPSYGATSRQIVKALQHAVYALGVPHPLHVHCNNLGLPGNVETALMTIAAVGDLPMHLAHVQFYSYGKEGANGFSSAAPTLAEAVNKTKNVTVDVGQAMFGQTVTISSDVLRQFSARTQAHPRKFAIVDGDSNGVGVVPYEYRAGSFCNAVQFAAGLELFLLIEDPSRVFFTTDHPNGAPFTVYPDLFALLMSRDLRAEWLSRVPREAAEMTTLASLKREYTLAEIATMTRAAPAKLLGLQDRGHLAPGARADVVVYRPDKDLAAMFRHAARVYKDGELVVRDGVLSHYRFGRSFHVAPVVDAAIRRRMARYYDERYGLSAEFMSVPEGAIPRPQPFKAIPCRA